jgi:hypothetical protein
MPSPTPLPTPVPAVSTTTTPATETAANPAPGQTPTASPSLTKEHVTYTVLFVANLPLSLSSFEGMHLKYMESCADAAGISLNAISILQAVEASSLRASVMRALLTSSVDVRTQINVPETLDAKKVAFNINFTLNQHLQAHGLPEAKVTYLELEEILNVSANPATDSTEQ